MLPHHLNVKPTDVQKLKWQIGLARVYNHLFGLGRLQNEAVLLTSVKESTGQVSLFPLLLVPYTCQNCNLISIFMNVACVRLIFTVGSLDGEKEVRTIPYSAPTSLTSVLEVQLPNLTKAVLSGSHVSRR